MKNFIIGATIGISVLVYGCKPVQGAMPEVPACPVILEDNQIKPGNCSRIVSEAKDAHNSLEENAKVNECEYFDAHRVWDFLKANGYSDCATAGIIGNTMVEVGGNTLNIQPELYSDDSYFYGICQWNSGAYGRVHGTTLNYQLDFLMGTIEQEFKTFGPAFGCSFEEFKSMDDEQLAARRFAQIYERCYAGSYGLRQSCAKEAYNHFANNA